MNNLVYLSNKSVIFYLKKSFILDIKKSCSIKQIEMASNSKGFTSQKSLEIKTKSIETTLVPLVTQISTLVNFKEKPRSLSNTNEKTLHAINRVGEAVHMAVERFVSVGRLHKYLFKEIDFSLLGESIGNENPEIKSDLIDACREARISGKSNN